MPPAEGATMSSSATANSCLARARTLHIKMDKLSAEVSARREPGHPKLPSDTDQPGGQVSSDLELEGTHRQPRSTKLLMPQNKQPENVANKSNRAWTDAAPKVRTTEEAWKSGKS